LMESQGAFLGSVSGSDLVNYGTQESLGSRMLITDQVATAPCTDPVQVRFLL
jgi:hypothetical protein